MIGVIGAMKLAISTTTLRWDALPPLWVIVLLIVPAVLFTVRFVYQRELGVQRRPLRIALGLLRASAVLLVFAALFGPYAETVEGEVAKRTLVIAIDTSRSMSLEDQYERNDELGDSLTSLLNTSRDSLAKRPRIKIAQEIIGGDAGYLLDLLETFDVQLFSFDTETRAEFIRSETSSTAEAVQEFTTNLATLEANGSVTRIGSAIRTLVRRLEARNEPVAGVFLFTDGRHTGGAPDPVSAAQAAGGTGGSGRGGEGIPIFPIPIGDPSAALNVGVTRVDAPEVVLAGDSVTFTAIVHARGCEGRDAKLEAQFVDTNGTILKNLMIDADPFRLPEDGEDPTQTSFRYTFPDKGTYDLRIGIPPLPGEAVVSDNYRRVTVQVVELKMNVLFVVDRPSYTYRFLGETLRRAEKTIRAQTLLLDAEPNWPMMSTRGEEPIRHFPRTRAELAKFDVVILQDVQPDSPRFGGEHPGGVVGLMKMLADWVKEGGGLVLQSGREMNFVTHYGSTELPALLPIIPGEWTLDARDRVAGSTATEKWLHLTDAGAAHPILQVLEDPTQARAFWESKEYENYFYSYTPVAYAKSSARVLATRREDKNSARGAEPHPVLALQDYGLGKVLWLAHEEFWRMRAGIDDPNLYYWRFWSGIIRHLATYRLLGGNKRVKIWVDRASGRYKQGETIGIEAKFLDEDFNPVAPEGTGGAPRTVVQIGPDGEESNLTLTALRTDPPEGRFRTQTVARAPGTYRLSAELPGDPEPAKATYVVEETTIEMRDPLVDLPTLESVAQASRGRVLQPAEFRRILEDRIVPPTSIVRSGEPRRTSLWDRAWVLWLFVALLGAEWVLRRLNNML